MGLRTDANIIIKESINKVLPDEAVKQALRGRKFGDGRLIVVACGKAAFQMAKAASDILDGRIDEGVVITKYGHVKGSVSNMTCFQAGHPIADSNSFRATDFAINMVSGLSSDDTVLFLVSGGGSALFEKPLVSGDELAYITNQLLSCGAEITEINTIRKRLSAVKGGRFAKVCSPAHIFSIVLSDIIGDPLDMIASGPAYPDSSTCADALNIVKKYDLQMSDKALSLMQIETPKSLDNVETIVTGSVKNLCLAAKKAAEGLGYKSYILTDRLSCEAKEAGSFLASIAQAHNDSKESLAFIAGGETVVHITGNGKGGRNQELALAAAPLISGLRSTAVFSIGSDGTDGPTDAAGGYVDNGTFKILSEKGIDIYSELNNNNSYYALRECGGLIITGPTGTNVNDVSVLLIKR